MITLWNLSIIDHLVLWRRQLRQRKLEDLNAISSTLSRFYQGIREDKIDWGIGEDKIDWKHHKGTYSTSFGYQVSMGEEANSANQWSWLRKQDTSFNKIVLMKSTTPDYSHKKVLGSQRNAVRYCMFLVQF